MHIEVYVESYLDKDHWKWFFKRTNSKHDLVMAAQFNTKEEAISNAKACISSIFKEVHQSIKFTTVIISPQRKIIKWTLTKE